MKRKRMSYLTRNVYICIIKKYSDKVFVFVDPKVEK